MNRAEYGLQRRQAYFLRMKLKALRNLAAMADSRTGVQIYDDLRCQMNVQHKINAIDVVIRPKGRDVMRLVYLHRKLERVYLLRARAGRENNDDAFSRYHQMVPAIQKEIRRG